MKNGFGFPWLVFAVLMVHGCLCLPVPTAWAQVLVDEVQIGGIFDISGPTSAMGQDYAEGAAAAVLYINEHGGINGLPVRLISRDYASQPSRAVDIYKTFEGFHEIYAIQGWGTADTIALKSRINRDEVVYMSACYQADLADPAKYPYNFFIASNYSDHARMAMKWAKENGAIRVSFIFPDHPYGVEPAKAGKDYAEKLGLVLGPDVMVDLRATDTTPQLLKMKEFDPDFAWIGGTSPSLEVIIRDAAKLDLRTKFLANTWAIDEKISQVLGDDAAGRLFGFLTVRPANYETPEMVKIKKYVSQDKYTVRLGQAWASMMVMWEGLKRARANGELGGPGLKKALETLKDFDTGGLTPPITYTRDDHRATTTCGLYAVKNGQLIWVSDVSLERTGDTLGW